MSNLPPGVNVNDIPGNRPEDIEYEEKWNRLFKVWGEAGLIKNSAGFNDNCDEEWFITAVDFAMELAYAQGWTDYMEEIKMEEAQKKWDEETERVSESYKHLDTPGEGFRRGGYLGDAID